MTPAIRSGASGGAGAAILLACLVLSSAQEKPPLVDQGLTVPPGFTVERVAGPPLVDRPIVADFDEDGRLYVADSSGSSEKVEKQLADKPHRIVRLEDTDDDGRFDTSVVFADKMMFPEGAMWFDGSLYVAAPPSIWKLTDTNGDGVADQREEWFQGKTLTGCANDLHGPYLGPDGWIYWTKGAFAQQTYERPGRAPFVTRASHIFRRRPGDTALDVVMTGGMDNPVDVAFTTTGERIFTATFLEHPQAGRRDALVHAVYGGVYGKPHAVLDGHKRTGDLMPVMLQLGPAVPAGLTRYTSNAFGGDYRDSFFAAMFNLRKVTRHVLTPSGATFESRDSDFLVSNNRDFHPTDVIEDAEGSLLVIDTGPWYKLCCPTSQLGKPDVLGAIYRVRREGAKIVSDPRGRRLAWQTMTPSTMAGLLDDGRTAVRNRAVEALGRKGSAALGPLLDVLRKSPSVEARRNAIWALTRIDGAPAREAVRLGLDDREATVRQVAIHSAALWRDTDALPQLRAALKADLPAVRRAAAEALGRIGDGRAVADLITAAAAESDRALEHSLTYALIEIDKPDAVVASGLQAPSSRARRAALIALDQMDTGRLQPDVVVPLLDSPDAVLKETAWWIASRHPEWGGTLASFFQSRLAGSLTAAEREDLQQKLARFAENAGIQELLAATVVGGGATAGRVAALRAMADTRLKMLPARWIQPLTRALADPESEVVRHAVTVARSAPAPKEAIAELDAALLRVARDGSQPLDARLEALGAVREGLTSLEPDLFGLLMSGLDPAGPASVRAAAAAGIEKATLSDSQLSALTPALKIAGPMELPRLLRAFDRSTDEAQGLAMLAALEEAGARSSLRPDILRPRLAKYPAVVQKRGEALLASLNLDAARQAHRLEELARGLQEGDVRRGQDVFNGSKAACYSCHAIGYLGGKIGPDLTRIGQVRNEQDLLEAIVFPNVSFARGFEPVVVRTRSGETHSGVLRGDLPDEVVLAIGERDEKRIPRREIADMQPGTVSLMPAGFDQQLTHQELADLLAFLKASR
jgi:putative membrane-bound dehydrogenase-like protein